LVSVIATTVCRLRRSVLGGLLPTLVLALAWAPACEKPNPPPEPGAKSSAGAEAGAEGASAEVEPPAPTLPDAESVLARAAEAMGGREAIDRVHSFYYRGTIDLVGQNIHGDLQIWWKGGDFFMEQIVPGIGEMRAGKEGEEIWAEDPVNGRRILAGVEAEQHAWASTVLLAADWKRYFDRAETIAEREVVGKKILDVRLASASGLEVVMSFEAESGLQVGQSFEQLTPMGKQPFEVSFQDYRDVDGIKIAFKQVIDAKVQKVVQVIDKVEINAEVDESRFAFPRRGADLVRQPSH